MLAPQTLDFTRKAFKILPAALNRGRQAPVQGSKMPIDIGPRAAVHLLNRIGYGPRPGDVDRILGMGLDRYIQGQLDAPADPELDSRLRGLITLDYPISAACSA